MFQGLGLAKNSSVVQCAKCKETIDASEKNCRFCSAPVDLVMSRVIAEESARLNQACDSAKHVRIAAGAMVVLFGMSFVPFLSIIGEIGFLFFVAAVPMAAIRWWINFGHLKSHEPDFRRARRDVAGVGGGVAILLASVAVFPTAIASPLFLSALHRSALYQRFGPSAASGEVVHVWAHPQHEEYTDFDLNGTQTHIVGPEEVLVFAEVRLHNDSETQLSLFKILTSATLPDGVRSGYAADLGQVFQAYPGIPVPQGPALPINLTLDPGQSADGTFVSSFRLTKQQWDARKDLSFSFWFYSQPALVLKPTAAVIEQ